MSNGKNRIDVMFADKRKKRFIPFITAGDPSLEVTYKIVHTLVEAGVDLIELGIPYSDPLADGPTIQRASQRALESGTTMPAVIKLVGRLRQSGITIPLVMFTYYNPILQYGIEQFFADLAAEGADGVVVPDLPVEENKEVVACAKRYNIHVISLVAPTSDQRIAMIGAQATGFLYCVSSLGVTGVRSQLPAELADFVRRARAHTSAPVAVGFGISTPEQVKEVASHADGIIVGSAIVQEIERNLPFLTDPEREQEGLARVKNFVQTLVGAIQ